MKAQRLRSKLLPLLLLLTLAAAAHSATRALPNPVPLVNNPLVPDAVAPGSQGFTLTVNGSGFVSGSVVLWNGVSLATSFVNSAQLTAIVPAADIATPGTALVAVTNPAPGGGTSSAALFDIRVPFTAASFGRVDLPVGMEPGWIATWDLNGDGKLDLITSLLRDSSVAILLGKGKGNFRHPVLHRTGGTPLAIAAGDFNQDGILDLAVCTGASVAVLLGKGDGRFQHHRDLPLNAGAVMIAAGDFDHNGTLDLAVALSQGGKVGVLLGKGDGTFKPVVTYPAGSDRAFGVATADFNGDGNLDLAVTTFSDSAVSILLGNGDGTFQSSIEYPTQFGPGSVVAGDFNSDRNVDLAVQTQLSGWISVLLNDGHGTFRTRFDYETPIGAAGIATVDLNGDNKLDLVVPNFGSGTISTFLGVGDGTFRARSDYATGKSPIGLAVGDFDGDGRIDLATADELDVGGRVSILRQVTSALSRTYLKFGNVQVGQKVTRHVTLSNIGTAAFDITRIILTGKSASGFSESNDCGTGLQAGASCTITVTFAPQTPYSYRYARVKISDTETNVPQKIYLFGVGVK